MTLQNHSVEDIAPSNFFGLMAYYSPSHMRSVSYRAQSAVTLLAIPHDVLDEIKINQPELYIKIDGCFTQIINSRLIEKNHTLVEDKKLIKSLLNFFAAVLLVSLITMVFVLVLCSHGNVFKNPEIVLGPTVLVVYMSIFLIMMKRSSFSRRFYGLTLEHWRRDTLVAILSSVVFIAVFTGIKYLMIRQFGFTFKLFQFPNKDTAIWISLLEASIYMAFVFVQELVSRGIIQGVVMSLAETPYEKIRGIVIVVLSFSASHLLLPSYLFAVVVIIPGLFWSLLYEYQGRRLCGVVVSHAIIGVYFTMVLGFGNAFLHTI